MRTSWLPVASIVNDTTVQQLAPETELDTDAGITNTIGSHALVVISLRTEALIEANLARFRQAGYPVVAQTVRIDSGVTMRACSCPDWPTARPPIVCANASPASFRSMTSG